MLNVLMVFVCILSTFAFVGCGDRELPSAKIMRDDARTGGSLSFVYDSKDRMVYVGGNEEVVQFSSKDEANGVDEGCRVGLKVIAPDENLDVAEATLEMNGVNYASGDFLEIVNGQKQRFFNLYPIVSKEDTEITFTIKWANGTKKQKYKIVVVEGTRFLDKEGNVTGVAEKDN